MKKDGAWKMCAIVGISIVGNEEQRLKRQTVIEEKEKIRTSAKYEVQYIYQMFLRIKHNLLFCTHENIVNGNGKVLPIYLQACLSFINR